MKDSEVMNQIDNEKIIFYSCSIWGHKSDKKSMLGHSFYFYPECIFYFLNTFFIFFTTLKFGLYLPIKFIFPENFTLLRKVTTPIFRNNIVVPEKWNKKKLGPDFPDEVPPHWSGREGRSQRRKRLFSYEIQVKHGLPHDLGSVSKKVLFEKFMNAPTAHRRIKS